MQVLVVRQDEDDIWAPRLCGLNIQGWLAKGDLRVVSIPINHWRKGKKRTADEQAPGTDRVPQSRHGCYEVEEQAKQEEASSRKMLICNN